jgi:transposase
VIRINLTEDEKHLLGEYFKTSSLKLIRLKAQAVLMRDKEMKLGDMSDLIFKEPRTIQRWLKDFSKKRMASIFSGHENNENAAKLTKEQKKEIAETLKKPPSEYGLPKEFWDIPSIKEYVRAEFGTIYESARSYHFLLKFSNFSFKLPEKFDIRRNDELVGKRIKEIREEIKKYLKNDEWEVFSADETRIQLEAITRRAWLKKGEKTIIKTERSNEYQNYLGLLNEKNFRCRLSELPWQNQEEIIKALEKLQGTYPNKRICLVWDNAGFHKGKLIKEKLKKGNSLERFHLINFPPYAPDANPVEHIWKESKQKISNIQFSSFENTKNAFRRSIAGKKFNYQI